MNYYNEIKEQIINNEITRKVRDYSKNKSDLKNKYDVSSLNKMRKFYFLIEKMTTVSAKLLYSHYVELLPMIMLKNTYYTIQIQAKKGTLLKENY